jgi:hypothetical protein
VTPGDEPAHSKGIQGAQKLAAQQQQQPAASDDRHAIHPHRCQRLCDTPKKHQLEVKQRM